MRKDNSSKNRVEIKRKAERKEKKEREIQGLRNGGSITIVMATIASTSLCSGRFFLSRASLRVSRSTSS